MEEENIESPVSVLQKQEKQLFILAPQIISHQVSEGLSQVEVDQLVNIPIELTESSRILRERKGIPDTHLTPTILNPTTSGSRKWRRRKGK